MNLGTIDEKITEVLARFDFAKCHSVMTMMDWKWSPIGRVPTVDEIRESAAMLLRSACEAAVSDRGHMQMHRTGGLVATVSANRVELEFVLARYETHVEDGYWV